MTEIKQMKAEFDTAVDSVKSIAEDFNGKVAHCEKISEDAKAQADEAIKNMNELRQQIKSVELTFSKPTIESEEKKSAGELFAEHIKNGGRLDSDKDKTALQIKSITSATAGAWLRELKIDAKPPEHRTDILDLIGVSELSEATSVSYVRETGFSNNARVVAEGDTKPESDLAFDNITVPLMTVAHWVLISRQMYEDGGRALIDYINNRLVFGLRNAIENQIINGTGGTSEFNGLLNQASDYDNLTGIPDADMNAIDVLRSAILQATLSGHFADGIVINPVNWTAIELAKNGVGQYVIGNPVGATEKRLWSLPVAEALTMPAGSFVVGAFGTGAQLFRKGGIRIEAGFEDRDNFIKNMVTILAEERMNFACYRPEAFVKGTFA